MSPSAFRHLQIVSAVLFFLGSFDSAGCAVPRGSTQVAADIVPDHLQVSSMIDPVGVDRKAPPLSWELHATASDARDLRQRSYEILVASSAEELAENRGSWWDSGRVRSDQRLYIAYGGQPLASHHTYFWKVRIWDQAGNASDWSAPSKWTTAILRPEEWTAHWIAAEPDGPLEPQARENQGYWTASGHPQARRRASMFLDPALMKSASMCKFSAARHPCQGGPRPRSDRVEGRAEGNPRVLARGIVGERFVQFPALKLSALHSDPMC